jgi:hypothetical protein
MSVGIEHARLRHGPEVVAVELAGCVVVFNERGGRVRSFNATGSIIWQQLDGSATVAEIAEVIAAELPVAPNVARADVCAFARDLVRHGFVERVR